MDDLTPTITKHEHFTRPKFKRVGVYCRVSSTRADQLASLAQQVSRFTRLVPSGESVIGIIVAIPTACKATAIMNIFVD
ncbi:MAG: hypothetical protein LBU32_02360 [Clostridiales bacterium]|nr:hypothetical protein [Clostridiales bacterium]